MDFPTETETDYQRIGGGPAVSAVVDEFYQRLTADEQVSHYFDDVSLPTLKRHQVLMISTILGGPNEYSGRDLDEAHQPLGITEDDYQRVGSHLLATLRDAGVPDDIQGRVGAALGQVQPAIVASTS